MGTPNRPRADLEHMIIMMLITILDTHEDDNYDNAHAQFKKDEERPEEQGKKLDPSAKKSVSLRPTELGKISQSRRK